MEDYLKAKQIVEEFEKKKPIPKPPLVRVIREGSLNICNMCGSTTSGYGMCHNQNCLNCR